MLLERDFFRVRIWSFQILCKSLVTSRAWLNLEAEVIYYSISSWDWEWTYFLSVSRRNHYKFLCLISFSFSWEILWFTLFFFYLHLIYLHLHSFTIFTSCLFFSLQLSWHLIEVGELVLNFLTKIFQKKLTIHLLLVESYTTGWPSILTLHIFVLLYKEYIEKMIPRECM